MKQQIEQLITSAIETLKTNGELAHEVSANIQVSRTKDESHGDFASNIAMVLSKPAKKNPRDLAALLLSALPQNEDISKTEIAGPGFINFFVRKTVNQDVIENILNKKSDYGLSQIGSGQRVLVEFVSANPTGPLHVGHGRGAAYGAALADLLQAAGYEVEREYYVNDAGRQMNILAISVWLRYLELQNVNIPFPSNGYRGDYIYDIAKSLKAEYQEELLCETDSLLENLPADEPDGGDKEKHIDALINRCQSLLSKTQYQSVFDLSIEHITNGIRQDLKDFGVEYDTWFSERSLEQSGDINKSIQMLRDKDYIFEQNGALWFKSTEFGDEKNRVVKRENGQTTYFASDIAYYLNKTERGFDRNIYVWGADHHGYIARLKAAATALTGTDNKFEVILVQFANLFRGQERIAMSTRTGEFVTLKELRQEVGNDAARFFYIMRRSEQHMDFDLELAKSNSKDNPVYYVQYAHARISNVFAKLSEHHYEYDMDTGLQNTHLLNQAQEEKLIKTLSRFPETVENAAAASEPHRIIYYLRELANDLHKYYDAHKIIIQDNKLRDARLTLAKATQQVLKNALSIIGVSAPNKM